MGFWLDSDARPRVAAHDLWRAARGEPGLGAAARGRLGLGDARRHARILRRRGCGAQPPRGRGPGWVPTQNSRVVLGLLCLATLVLPVLIIASEAPLNNAKQALFESKNCTRASSSALSSIGWLDVRPEPYEILGFCDIQRGQPGSGSLRCSGRFTTTRGSWETYYTLAIAQAASGVDPRPAAQRALRMNPRDPLTQEEAREFNTSSPTEWVSRAHTVPPLRCRTTTCRSFLPERLLSPSPRAACPARGTRGPPPW